MSFAAWLFLAWTANNYKPAKPAKPNPKPAPAGLIYKIPRGEIPKEISPCPVPPCPVRPTAPGGNP